MLNITTATDSALVSALDAIVEISERQNITG